MHPLVAFAEELRRLRELTVRVAQEEAPEVEYLCGTMIELPRACIRADEIAEQADFFSFGTNDLTQTALGFSRDDAEGKFLTHYLEDGVLEKNPFETLDVEGVGDLMRIAVERGRSTKPEIKLGICGEHGGEPKSVAFCHELGLDYVSCSPYRVPLARLAAAQAALAEAGATAVRGRRRLMGYADPARWGTRRKRRAPTTPSAPGSRSTARTMRTTIRPPRTFRSWSAARLPGSPAASSSTASSSSKALSTWDEVRARRLARSFLTTRASTDRLVEVVHDLCGVHAQVQASAELQLGARIDGITQQDVRDALWERRELVKAWTLRGTLHLHPAAELPLWYAAARAVCAGRAAGDGSLGRSERVRCIPRWDAMT